MDKEDLILEIWFIFLVLIAAGLFCFFILDIGSDYTEFLTIKEKNHE